MFILQLAGDGETKISCPSLSPACPEPTQSQAKDLSEEVTGSTLVHTVIFLAISPKPAVTEVPLISESLFYV